MADGTNEYTKGHNKRFIGSIAVMFLEIIWKILIISLQLFSISAVCKWMPTISEYPIQTFD
jgi:hypothetical protein